MQHHLRPAQARDVAGQVRTSVHGARHGVADAEVREHGPAEDVGSERGVVLSVIMDDGDAVLVEAEVEFLVDGVQVHERVDGEADHELEEEVAVAQDRFVGV